MFITLYGINNMGKTTQCLRIVERLRAEGRRAEYVKFPIYDLAPSGPFLNAALRGGAQKITEQELQLWFVVNRQQFQPQLMKWLEEGVDVIAEDYVGTGIAWGMTKGLEREWLETINEGLVVEDLAILIHGERVKAATESGHVHEENDDLMARCQENFLSLADDKGWKKIELESNLDKMTEKIYATLKEGEKKRKIEGDIGLNP